MECDEFNRWTMTELPRLNRAILAGREPPDALVRALAGTVLRELPAPETLSRVEASRLVVLLGLAGASVARHYQEEDLSRKAQPERSFDGLRVGALPFPEYFRRVALASGTGHPPRDAYASLVRWNLPTVEVRGGSTPTVLPGVFGDDVIRTYTGDPGEVSFFTLLKESEALELAANDALQPIADGAVGLEDPEALERVGLATRLLQALRRLNTDFAATPGADGGLRPEHFLDVFRQFAVHWVAGDVPPSGAQDPEFLRRDLLLGIDYPGYGHHLNRVLPTLLDVERAVLTRQLDQPPLPVQLLRRLGLTAGDLAAMPPAALRAAVARHPALGAWYLLLVANAQFASTHHMLTERFLFRPQRSRDQAGVGDRLLVSNRRGTTGMDPPLLEQLAHARRRHPLAPLVHIPRAELLHLAGLPVPASPRDPELANLIHTHYNRDSR